MVGVGDVALRGRAPVTQSRGGSLPPSKRPRGRRLGLTVDDHGIVRGRAAKEVTTRGVAGVAVRSGVDEVWLAEDGALHTQEISVAVAATHGTPEGSDVEDQLMRVALPSASHDHVAALGEEPRGGQRRRRGFECVERLQSGRPQQPERLRRRRPGGPGTIGPTEKRSRRREDTAEVVLSPPGKRQERAAVRVADLRHRAIGVA